MSATKTEYSMLGRLVTNIKDGDVQIVDNAPPSEPVTGITPRGEPLGWAHGDRPGGTITYVTTMLNGEWEFDYEELKRSKREFTWGEHFGINTQPYLRCVVNKFEPQKGNVRQREASVEIGWLEKPALIRAAA